MKKSGILDRWIFITVGLPMAYIALHWDQFKNQSIPDRKAHMLTVSIPIWLGSLILFITLNKIYKNFFGNKKH